MSAIHAGQVSIFDLFSAPQEEARQAARASDIARVHIQVSGRAGNDFSFRIYGKVITEIDVANWTPSASWLIDNTALDYYMQHGLASPDDVIDVFVHRFFGVDDDLHNAEKAGTFKVSMRECMNEWAARCR